MLTYLDDTITLEHIKLVTGIVAKSQLNISNFHAIKDRTPTPPKMLKRNWDTVWSNTHKNISISSQSLQS